MKKTFVLILVFAIILSGLFAGQYHTVPLGDMAYEIITTAELRGLIPIQSNVKPYNLDKVLDLLTAISSSGKVSEKEIADIDRLIDGYIKSYGIYPSNSVNSVLRKGNVAYSFGDTNISIGVKASSDSRVGFTLNKDKIISSRNLATAYIAGDISDYVSYDINFSLVLDKLDTHAYHFNDFQFTSDGQYFVGSLDRAELDGQEGIGIGLSTSSEITSTLLDGKVSIQAGAFKRDWGPGLNNLGLSGSASKFNGIQIQIEPSEWFSFSSLVGSLGLSFFGRAYPMNNSVGEYKDYLPASTYNDFITDGPRFDNNYSIHRAEFTFGSFKASLYEATVWKKRFEFSYISPVSIYWIAQNYLGDWDSLIGGFDFSYTFKGVGRVYVALSIDEFTTDIKHIFTNPRNIIAIQGGSDLLLNVGEYGLMTIQATYIPPFFGSHYDNSRQDWGGGYYSVTYANAGKNLSYPIHPDSLELLFAISCGVGNGLNLELTLKDQMQSAQYTLHESYDMGRDGSYVNAGLSVNDCMDYDSQLKGLYASKSFFKHIWKNTLDFDVTVSKRFENIPLSVTLGLNVIADWTRNFTAKIETSSNPNFNPDEYNMGALNFGHNTEMGSWNIPTLRFLGRIGFTVYY